MSCFNNCIKPAWFIIVQEQVLLVPITVTDEIGLVIVNGNFAIRVVFDLQLLPP